MGKRRPSPKQAEAVPTQRLDWEAHQAAKEASRKKDAEDLASGKKTHEELSRENGHFAGLRVRIDWKKSRTH